MFIELPIVCLVSSEDDNTAALKDLGIDLKVEEETETKLGLLNLDRMSIIYASNSNNNRTLFESGETAYLIDMPYAEVREVIKLAASDPLQE